MKDYKISYFQTQYADEAFIIVIFCWDNKCCQSSNAVCLLIF